MQEPYDNVRHLDTRVVDVVLNFDTIAGGQNSLERVAKHSVPNVADVGRLVRIDARVLDHLLRLLVGSFIIRSRVIGKTTE